MSTRSRKEEITYKKYRKQVAKDVCQFCDLNKNSSQLLKQSKHFKIIKNIFSYSLWDAVSVEDHLMIVPNKHTDTLGDLTPYEAKEFVDLIAKYEKIGYNVYARPPKSIRKTIVHQHTHLIKTKGNVKKFIFTIHKPFYIRMHR